MPKLILEKEETLTGTTKYAVFYGINCLFVSETIGEKAMKCTDGRTVAETLAQAEYDSMLAKIKDGYPKKSILFEYGE